MLREILFALCGHVGDLFHQENDEIKFVGEAKYMTTGEKSMINKILILSKLYLKIKDFVETEEEGKYYGILKLSLDHALDAYRQEILDLEKLVFKGQLSLCLIFSRLQKYQVLFCSMVSLIDEINAHHYRGCHLLSVVYKYTSSGIDLRRTTFTRVLRECSQVLYAQLINWLLHGILVDAKGEFFIEDLGASSKPNKRGFESGQVTPLDLSVWDTNHDNFCLRADMIPVYIKIDTANKILFIGQSVLLLRNKYFNPKGISYFDELYDMKKDFESAIQLSDKSDYYSFLPFEGVIDRMSTTVSEQLYMIVVDDGKLLSELHNLKDIYLLGRGELFWTFLKKAESLLCNQVTPSDALHNELTSMFHLACQQVFMEESFYDNMAVSLVATDTDDKSGWSQVKFIFPITPPLQILFSESIIDKYNSVMCFLMEVRRSHMAVLESWRCLLKRRSSQKDCNYQLWQLVDHMLFIINNLQQYFMADVLEVHSSDLFSNVLTTGDYEKIRSSHEIFLNNIQAEVFLLNKIMISRLRGILSVCNYVANEVIASDTGQMDLKDCKHKFYQELALFFRILYQHRAFESRISFNQLTMRLDFNKYFTRHTAATKALKLI